MKIVAIVNPVAGFHLAPLIWPRLLEARGDEGSRVTTWWTEGQGHAETLAARARREGFDRVLAVGGDGTLLEVVNGLWWESQGPQPSVGTVPFGTGCDYVRNFACDGNLADYLTIALGEATAPVSVGRVRLQGLDGRPYQRVFVNVLGAGFDAGVIERFQRRRLRLPGKVAYAWCVLRELYRLSHYHITGEVNGRALTHDVLLLAIGLGRYFGGGMMITPGASPDSDHFQVVLAQRLTRLAVLGLLPKIYKGQHLEHPQLLHGAAGHIAVSADPPALVEAEGELIGRTPLDIEVLPRALQFAGQPIKSGSGKDP